MSQNQDGFWKQKLYQLFVQYGITKIVFQSSNNYVNDSEAYQSNLTVEIDTEETSGLTNSISVPVKPRMLYVYSKNGDKTEFVNDLALRPKMLTFNLDTNKLNETGYQVVYENLKKHLEQKERDESQGELMKLAQQINQQLSKSFYKDVKMVVYLKQLDKDGRKIAETTVKTDYKNPQYDIKLNITLDAGGKPTIKHVVSDDYLKEYVNRWEQEAKARGMNVSIDNLRQQVIHDFESEEAEQTFYKAFIQDTKAVFNSSIGGYVEAVQATQKVTKHIWDEGTINRGIWHSRGDDAQEHKQWPEYMHMQPVLGGATDGVVDEIVGIPLACKSIYEIATDDEKKQAFAQVFTKEGFANLLEGLESQAKGILDDPQRQQHFGGQTTISIASMFVGTGAVTKLGKLDELGELVEIAAKKGDEFVEGATTLSKIDELKKLARHLEGEKVFDDLVKEFDASTIENRLDDLINEAKSIDKAKRADFWKNARKFIIRGNKFNDIVRAIKPPKYKFHEVTIEHPTLKYLDGPNKGKPKRFRLDSYTHGKYIVSRKATDFDRIKPETFRSYLDELLNKYPPGAKIKSVAEDNAIYDKLLKGELIMEVPLSNKTSKRLKEFESIMKEEKYKHIKLVFEKE